MHASSFGEAQKSSLYTLTDIAEQGMRCSEFVLRAGESAYLPKGAIHFAVTTVFANLVNCMILSASFGDARAGSPP